MTEVIQAAAQDKKIKFLGPPHTTAALSTLFLDDLTTSIIDCGKAISSSQLWLSSIIHQTTESSWIIILSIIVNGVSYFIHSESVIGTMCPRHNITTLCHCLHNSLETTMRSKAFNHSTKYDAYINDITTNGALSAIDTHTRTETTKTKLPTCQRLRITKLRFAQSDHSSPNSRSSTSSHEQPSRSSSSGGCRRCRCHCCSTIVAPAPVVAAVGPVPAAAAAMAPIAVASTPNF